MKTKVLSLVILSAITISCSNSNKPKSESGELKANVEHDTEGSEVTACQHASKIYWEASKPTGSHTGIIKLKSGKYIVNDNELVGGSFVLDMNSILNIDLENEGMNAKLVNHLKSPDFFHVDSFPEGMFSISKVEVIKHENYTHKIYGNLTLKQKSHPIEFMAKVNVHEGVVNATSEEFKINRTLWGINYQSKSVFKELTDKFIDDHISIKIEAHSM